MEYWIVLPQLIAIVFLIYLYVHKKYSYWSSRGVSGPKPVPFFGNVFELLRRGQTVTSLEWANKYGPVFGKYTGFQPTLTISDPELIKQVMVKDFSVFMNRRKDANVDEIGKHNLFNAEGDAWKRIRTITSPSFTSGKLKGMQKLMHACVDKLANYLSKMTQETGEAVISTKEVIAGFTIDVIASTSFATETNSNGDRAKQNPFVTNGLNLFNFSVFRILLFILAPTPIRAIVEKYYPRKEIVFFIELARQVVKNRRETGLKRNDFVQLLIDSYVEENRLEKTDYDDLTASNDKDEDITANNQKLSNSKVVKTLTDTEIIAQCIIFFVAGFETTASTISYCIYELSKNPEIQERLHEILVQELDGMDTTSEKYFDTVMNKIPFLEAVVKETLRKYDPLPTLERRVGVSGYKLGGIELQKDQVVHINSWAVHYNEKFYPEPEKFNPDRFMPENKHNLVPYTYLPFGQGPRNCIGMRFAYQEIKLCLARIIREFQFAPTQGTPDRFQFSKFGLLTVKSFPLKVSKGV